MIDPDQNDIFAYLRTSKKEKVLVVTNFRAKDVVWKLPKGLEFDTSIPFSLLISNYGVLGADKGVVKLGPFEAFACFVK